MDARFFNFLVSRFHRRAAKKYHDLYLNHPNRDALLAVYESKLNRFIDHAYADAYQSELVEEFQFALQNKHTFVDLVKKLLKLQQQWAGQHYWGTEYDQPYIPLDRFVYVTAIDKILKHILRMVYARIFQNLIEQLKQARQRGGLRDREELAILRRFVQGEQQANRTAQNPERGFRWVSPYAKARIEALYERLIKAKYIHTTTKLENFAQIFSGDPVEHPTIWLKPLTALICLFQQMISQEMLTLDAEMEKNRCDKQGLEKLLKETSGEQHKKYQDQYMALQQKFSSWFYACLRACFLNEKLKPYSGKQLKNASNQLNNRNRNKTPMVARDLERLLKVVSSVNG
jgi:hypothetical protein